jgi:hypothetical protein
LAAHVDLPCRLYAGEVHVEEAVDGLNEEHPTMSTHTWILYLRDCDGHHKLSLALTRSRILSRDAPPGGHTELLTEDDSVSAQVQPRRGTKLYDAV